jgi:hypothetical protein
MESLLDNASLEVDMRKTAILVPDLIRWSDRLSGLWAYAFKRLQADWMRYGGEDLNQAYHEAEDMAAWEMECQDVDEVNGNVDESVLHYGRR